MIRINGLGRLLGSVLLAAMWGFDTEEEVDGNADDRNSIFVDSVTGQIFLHGLLGRSHDDIVKV